MTRRWTWRRRVVGLLAAVASVCLGATVVVVASVWSESRYPSDVADASSATRVRGVVTRPVVQALSNHVRRRVRDSFRRRMDMTGLSFEETIARLRDESLTDEQRGVYAMRLARVGSPEAVAALLELFETAPPEHRAFLAQLLGSTGDPSVAPWLIPLLDDADARVVIAAIRGLAALDGYDATPLLAELLRDSRTHSTVRFEAAIGLGSIGSTGARDVLLAVLPTVRGSELSRHVLDALGHFPFPDVERALGAVIYDERAQQDERVVAVEALFHSTADAVPLLVDVAGSCDEADLRAAAAWTLSAHEGDAALGPRLVSLARSEPEADVRRRLYEAVLAQRVIPAGELLETVRDETDVAARVAGFNAVSEAIGRSERDAPAQEFDDLIVPELARIASSPNSLNVRVRAVFALRRARTPAARDALANLSTVPCPQVAAAAGHGLGKIPD